MQADVKGVFDAGRVGGVVAVGADGGGDGFRAAEEGDALVDEVRAEVEEEAVGGARDLFPGVRARDGTEAVEVRLKGDETAEGAGFEELSDGEEVGVPTAVVEGRGDEIAVAGEVNEGGGLLAGSGEGLVEDDVAAGEEALAG